MPSIAPYVRLIPYAPEGLFASWSVRSIVHQVVPFAAMCSIYWFMGHLPNQNYTLVSSTIMLPVLNIANNISRCCHLDSMKSLKWSHTYAATWQWKNKWNTDFILLLHIIQFEGTPGLAEILFLVFLSNHQMKKLTLLGLLFLDIIFRGSLCT